MRAWSAALHKHSNGPFPAELATAPFPIPGLHPNSDANIIQINQPTCLSYLARRRESKSAYPWVSRSWSAVMGLSWSERVAREVQPASSAGGTARTLQNQGGSSGGRDGDVGIAVRASHPEVLGTGACRHSWPLPPTCSMCAIWLGSSSKQGRAGCCPLRLHVLVQVEQFEALEGGEGIWDLLDVILGQIQLLQLPAAPQRCWHHRQLVVAETECPEAGQLADRVRQRRCRGGRGWNSVIHRMGGGHVGGRTAIDRTARGTDPAARHLLQRWCHDAKR